VQALGLIAEKLALSGGLWDWIAMLNEEFGALGYLIIALFIVSWIVSVAIYRLKATTSLKSSKPYKYQQSRQLCSFLPSPFARSSTRTEESIPMMLRNLALFAAGCLVGAVVIDVLPISVGTPNVYIRTDALPNPPPLVLADRRVFYAGGRYDKDHPDQHFVGQMYVEYQIPARASSLSDRPHPRWWDRRAQAGGQRPTAARAWAQYSLRRGYAVYVVDQVARGRSPSVPKSTAR
jgi:hypothetical protein